jgi:hypothetical protein
MNKAFINNNSSSIGNQATKSTTGAINKRREFSSGGSVNNS